MNLRPFPLYFSLLVGACSLAVSAAAQDQAVNGNLFVSGSFDVSGGIASFGLNGANPGYSLIYTNGAPATVDFSASAAGVNWVWSQATNQPQLKLDSTNTLSLFVPGSSLASITLNPAGTSTFSQGLTVTGTLTASGGLASPNGIVTGGATGLSLQAGGTGNQNITLVPTGTGVTTTASPVTVTNATASSSTTTGALIVTGGVGVNGTLTAGNVTTGGTVNAGTLKVTNVATSLTNLGLGMANTANFGAINAADPSFFYPAPVAKVSHTVTTGPFLSAPQVVTVAGNFAYVGSSSSTSFQILDITNPLLPVKRGSLVGTGVAPAANLSFPRGIAISGSYAYVTSSSNNSLQVINITAPDAPTATGSLLNGAGGALLSAPYGIAVSGSYAYIASSSSNALEIVNITNPAAPVHAGKLTDATKLLGARAVAVSGSYAYVVSNTGNCLTVVNISNPAAPTLAASLAHNAAGPLLAGPTAIAISGNYAYVTSATSNALQIIDISNPLVPVAKGSLVSGTAGAQLTSPSALTVVGTTAFVTASGTTKAVQIVDVSNPLAPTPKGQLLDGSGGALLNGPTSIAVSGNYAYVASSSSNALQVLSIASGGGFQIQNATVLTKDANNNLLLGSGLPTGKVAIGTTNATSRLTVAGTDTTAASSVVNFTDSANKSLLFVQNDGKVGLGTTTPGSMLDLNNGRVRVSNNTGGTAIYGEFFLNGYNPTILVNNQSGFSNLDLNISGTNYSFMANPFGNNQMAGLSFNSNAAPYGRDFAIVNTSNEKGIGLHTSGNASPRFYVNNLGNVGIGTNTPVAKLHVVGGDIKTTQGSIASGAGTFTGIQLGVEGAERPRIGFHVSDNSRRFKIEVNNINTASERLGVFSINGGASAETEALSVNKNGNVGIGTTTPTERLEVNGNLKVSGQIITPNGTLTIPASTGTILTSSGNQTITGATTFAGTTTAGGATAAQQVKVDATGNVGIGTANLSGNSGNMIYEGKLQINATGADVTALNINGNSTGYAGLKIKIGAGNISGAPDYYDFTVRPSYASGVSQGPDVSAIRINNTYARNDPDLLLLKAGGNVGIGTITPTAKLDVAGSIKSTGGYVFQGPQTLTDPNLVPMQFLNYYGLQSLAVKFDGANLADVLLSFKDSGSEVNNWSLGRWGARLDKTTATFNILAQSGATSDVFRVSTSGAAIPFLKITPSGNVGIGNTAPGEKLDVTGNAKVSGTLTVGGQPVVTTNQLTSYATTAQVTTQLAPYATSNSVTTQLASYQQSTGSGSGLTALNASEITTGFVPADRIADNSLPWAKISNKPNTVDGYAITDAVKKTPTGDVTVSGTTTLQGVVTVKTVLRIPESGDLGMGIFKTGTNPAN